MVQYHIHIHLNGDRWAFRKRGSKKASVLGFKNEGRWQLIEKALGILLKKEKACQLVIHSKGGEIDRLITLSEGKL